jgi:hypothetical protein
VQLHRAREQFDAAGARLVVVGQGTPAHAADFRRRQHVEDLMLLVDSEREAYRLAGTRRASLGELLGPKVAFKGLKATLRGHPQGATFGGGDPAQLGGVLVVAPDGSIPWGHLSEDASDNPPVDEVLDAARAAAAA